MKEDCLCRQDQAAQEILIIRKRFGRRAELPAARHKAAVAKDLVRAPRQPAPMVGDIGFRKD
jgi:hypothetical protein